MSCDFRLIFRRCSTPLNKVIHNKAGHLKTSPTSTLKATKKRLSSGDCKFSCPICDCGFSRKFNRDQHISSHTNDVPCRICLFSFRTENALQSHLVAKHTPRQLKTYLSCKPTMIQCESCPEKFTSYYGLYFHDQKQHSADPLAADELKCTECGKFFADMKLLQHHHMKKHEQAADDTTCETCGKVFATKQSLKFHERIHTGSKPVKCSDCPETFRCESHLRQHRITYHLSSSIKCALCGQTFSRSNYLKAHLKNHFKEQEDGNSNS